MRNTHEQILLRVKQGSELDVAIRSLSDSGKGLTKEEVEGLTGLVRTYWMLKSLDKSVDNIRVIPDGNSIRLNYVDVIPTVPVPVGVDTVISRQDIIVPEMADVKWPQAPPMVDSMEDKYREPSWFKVMATMVKLGRHISLAGAPGVGKDTAVQELAAREGKPLVTVGGDAGFRRRDLVGTVNISNGKSFLEVAEYAAAVVNGWWAVISEVNAADADALLFINTQLAAPYVINIAGKAYPVHPDFRLFITYNPGLVGTKPLPQSFKDRFYSVAVPFFSKVQLKSVLESHGLPADTEWATKLVHVGMEIWNAHERGAIRYQITTRRLQDATLLMTSGMAINVVEALTMAVLAAIDSPVEAQTVKQIIINSGGI